MEIDNLRELERRIIYDFMELAILSLLYHDGSHASGYDIIKHLHKRFGLLISSGHIYSHLYALERKGLLKGSHIGRKRVYTLTKKGTDAAKMVIHARDRISKFVSSILQKFNG